MITNLDIWRYSLEYPEPILDPYYEKEGTLILSVDPLNPTKVMIKNRELHEYISAYGVAKRTKNNVSEREILEYTLEIILSCPELNCSEFVSFWSVVDVSYSFFTSIKNKQEQITVLQNLLDAYLNDRYGLYSLYGFSPTTLQACRDSKAHKASGRLGLIKVSKILTDHGFSDASDETLEDFQKGDQKYITSDQQGKKLFKKLLEHYRIHFAWKDDKDNKMPDFLLRIGKDLFIVEHKHTKEGGGGQDKQVNELVSFVSFSEASLNIHYISFMDGVYFNKWKDSDSLRDGKVLNQLTNIEENLIRNTGNYFVNTEGFKRLISHYTLS